MGSDGAGDGRMVGGLGLGCGGGVCAGCAVGEGARVTAGTAVGVARRRLRTYGVGLGTGLPDRRAFRSAWISRRISKVRAKILAGSVPPYTKPFTP